MVAMSSEAEHPQSVQFRPERTHLLAVLILTGIGVLAIGAEPLLLIPVILAAGLFTFWLLRVATVVDASGISLSYAFRTNRHVAWEDLAGVGFRGARALATTKSGEEYMMPGVSFNSLPRLSEASQGRIPDALTAGQQAADEKVTLIHRDGEQVLLTQEEYAARQAAQHADGQAEDHPTNNSPRSNP